MAILKTKILLVASLLLMSSEIIAQANISREYQVKAVFLFNFAQFVEWPTSTFSSEDAPFVIGVLGKDPFGDYLNETVKGEKINGHTMAVKYFQDIKEVSACHILFINPVKSDQLTQMLTYLKLSGKRLGFMINFNVPLIKNGIERVIR